MKSIRAILPVVLCVSATVFAAAPHPADGPAVQHVCAVAPDILSITLQAGTFVPNELTPYVAQPGDEVVNENLNAKGYIVKGGKVIEDFDKALFRTVDGKKTRVASLSPDGSCIFKESKMAGATLDETAVDTLRRLTRSNPRPMRPTRSRPLRWPSFAKANQTDTTRIRCRSPTQSRSSCPHL